MIYSIPNLQGKEGVPIALLLMPQANLTDQPFSPADFQNEEFSRAGRPQIRLFLMPDANVASEQKINCSVSSLTKKRITRDYVILDYKMTLPTQQKMCNLHR